MKNYITNFSEIAPLKKILLHRPGNEFLNLTPNTLERLLFDDIPYLKIAQQEHDAFANALRSEGVEVIYLVDLMAEALDSAGRAARSNFIKQFIAEAGVTAPKAAKLCYKLLNSQKDNRALASKCIEGIDDSEIKELANTNGFYASREVGKMIIDPLPNLFAPRDPFATIGYGVTIHRMQYAARRRETAFIDFIFRHHPFYNDVKLYYDREEPYSIEGGDIQVLSPEVVVVGISERTEPDAIATFAKNLFKDKTNNFKYVLAIDIPDVRSFMHLDTVMTQVDVDKFAVHAHVMDISTVYEITDAGGGELEILELKQNLRKILEKYLYIDHIEMIKCGNGQRIAAEREQWSDGVNFICVRPGVVIGYDRNFVTNETLRKHGVRVIEIPSSELSRGRGGTHCMSMSLVREDNNSKGVK